MSFRTDGLGIGRWQHLAVKYTLSIHDLHNEGIVSVVLVQQLVIKVDLLFIVTRKQPLHGPVYISSYP